MDMARLEEVVKRIDERSGLLRAWRLEGGVSAQVTALEVRREDGVIRRMVVRQHGAADLERDRDMAWKEYRLMSLLKSKGMPVPAPYYIDRSGSLFPDPYLVVEYVEGTPLSELPGTEPLREAEAVRRMAEALALLHRVEDGTEDVSFLGLQQERVKDKLADCPVSPDESLDESLIREALAETWPPSDANGDVILHGDYWPGNILWHDGRLAAILDWEDAAFGDPLSDLANGRLEILWAFGPEAMQAFTDRYTALSPRARLAGLPLWDLFAALRPASRLSNWGLAPGKERLMRERHHWFVRQALGTL